MLCDMVPVDNASSPRATEVTGAVGKIGQLLYAFSTDGGPASLTELARRSGLAKSTTHRLLHALADADLVERRGSAWVLSSRFVDHSMSRRKRPEERLVQSARPWLVEAHRHVGPNAVHLAVRDGAAVVLVDRVSGPSAADVPTRIGLRLPMQRTAVGRSLRVETLRRQSHQSAAHRPISTHSLTHDGCGCLVGIQCVAAPVFAAGLVVAAVSVTGWSTNMDPQLMSRVSAWAAGRISEQLATDRRSLHSVASAAQPSVTDPENH